MADLVFETMDRMSGIREAAAQNHAVELAKLKKEDNKIKSGRNRMDTRPSNPVRNGVLLAGMMGSAAIIAATAHGEVQPSVHPGEGLGISVELGSNANNSVAPEVKNTQPPKHEKLDQVHIQALIDKAPALYREKAKVSIPAVVDALHTVGIDSNKVIAYLLATSEPESNLDLEMEEIDGPAQAKLHGYDGGIWGRGFMPLTHEYNYRDMSVWLPKYFPQYKGIDLVKNPDLAKRADISAAIAAVFMKEKGVAAAVEAGNLDRARELVYGKITENDKYGQQVKNSIDLRYAEYLQVLEKRAAMLKSVDDQLDRVLAR